MHTYYTHNKVGVDMNGFVDIALGFGLVTFVMIWCYVDGHVKDWKNDEFQNNDLDYNEYRPY
jgi:hypothetical protein